MSTSMKKLLEENKRLNKELILLKEDLHNAYSKEIVDDMIQRHAEDLTIIKQNRRDETEELEKKLKQKDIVIECLLERLTDEN